MPDAGFKGGADDIPTFSFADLRSCALKNDKDYFKRWFEGKVIIFGTVLDGEDRRLTSKRFATGVEGAREQLAQGYRCLAYSGDIWLYHQALSEGLAAIRAGIEADRG